MAHSLAPSFLKVFYTSSGHVHVQLLPVYGHYVLGDVYLVSNAGSDILFHTAVDAYVQRYKALFNVGDAINYVEYWEQADENADPVWKETYEVAVSGTNNGADVANSETVYTFRCDDGSLLKVYAMENANLYTFYDRAPLTSGSNKDFADWVVGSTGIIQSRAGGRPSAVISARSKINDILRKKYGTAT